MNTIKLANYLRHLYPHRNTQLSQIMTYVKGSTVLKKEERRDHLVMVWEGEIVECHTHDQDAREPVTFHAGDWTGPLTFQPNVDQSCEASR